MGAGRPTAQQRLQIEAACGIAAVEMGLETVAMPGPEFEHKILATAAQFHAQEGGETSGSQETADSGTLILIDWNGRRRIHGRSSALDELALAQACGARKPA